MKTFGAVFISNVNREVRVEDLTPADPPSETRVVFEGAVQAGAPQTVEVRQARDEDGKGYVRIDTRAQPTDAWTLGKGIPVWEGQPTTID